MKPYVSLLVFIALIGSSLLAGTGSYLSAEDEIRRDLSSALSLTLAQRQSEILNTDTINACRKLQSNASGEVSLLVSDDYFNRRLSIPQLRGRSYIALSLLSDGRDKSSCLKQMSYLSCDTMVVSGRQLAAADVKVAFRGCAECSFLTVMRLSDQRMSVMLSFMALLWAAFSLSVMRRRKGVCQLAAAVAETETVRPDSVKTCGDMSFDTFTQDFYDAQGATIKLTPMQSRLMGMFFNTPSGKLSKQEICDNLWPRKPDANDTLYTLIRRLKPVIEASTNLTIESERGRAYRLKTKD